MINLGSNEVIREVKIGASLVELIHSELVKLHCEYVDVFAWSYQYILRLDTNIIEHRLTLKPECPPVK